jgi:hypothetical protein
MTLELLHLTDLNGEQLRKEIGLLIVPAAFGANLCLLFSIGRQIGLRMHECLLLTLLALVSFSNIIFASLPDHFPISNTLITAAFYWSLTRFKKDATLSHKSLFVLGILFAGITVTNIAFLGIITASFMYFSDTRRMTGYAKLCGVLMLSVLTAYALGMSWDVITGRNIYVSYHNRFFHLEISTILSVFASFPTVLADSIVGPLPAAIPNLNPHYPGATIAFQFSYRQQPSILTGAFLPGLFTLVAILCGAFGLFRSQDTSHRALLSVAVLIIMSNWAMHTLWGFEFFLYSQHWIFAELALIAGLLVLEGKWRWPAQTMLIALITVASINNYSVVHALIERLENV